MTKEEKKAYNTKYYKLKKEEIKKQKKEYYKTCQKFKNYKNRKTLLKLNKQKPTDEQIEVMKKAACAHIKSVNKYRYYNILTLDGVLSDAYIGLLMGLKNYDPINNNLNAFLYNKVKFYLVDCYRAEYGRKDHKKINETTTISLSQQYYNDSEKEIDQLNFAEEQVEYDLSIHIDSEAFLSTIKEVFYREANTKQTAYRCFFIFKKLLKGLTMQKIGDELGMSQSAVSYINSTYIKPFFKIAQELIIEANPSYYG